MIKTLRNNKVAAWCIALFMGLVFRYIDGIARQLIFTWCRNWDFGTSTHPTPESQFLVLTILSNFALNFASSLISSILCGGLLVYLFHGKARQLCIGSVAIFLVLSSRLWRFWKFPALGMQISSLIGPIIAGIVLASTVWLIVKLRKHITADY